MRVQGCQMRFCAQPASPPSPCTTDQGPGPRKQGCATFHPAVISASSHKQGAPDSRAKIPILPILVFSNKELNKNSVTWSRSSRQNVTTDYVWEAKEHKGLENIYLEIGKTLTHLAAVPLWAAWPQLLLTIPFSCLSQGMIPSSLICYED